MSDDFDGLFDSNTNDTEQPATVETTDQHPATEEVVETPDQIEPETETATADAEPGLIDDRDEDEKLPATVPLATFLNVKNTMRDKLKAAEQLAAQHQARLDEYQRAREVPQTIPDPYYDPKGYADHRFAEIENQRLNDKILLSGEFAKRTHGAGKVAEAAQWASAQAASDPKFDAMVASQPDPIEWVIQQHDAVQKQARISSLVSEVDYDVEALALKLATERGWIASENAPAVKAAPAATPTPAKVRPTTLKDIPTSISKVTPRSEQDDFDALFKR